MVRQNISKTIHYMKRNGIKKAVGTVYERLTARYDEGYFYEEPAAEALAGQREAVFGYMPLVSIVVPAYETKETFLTGLIDSVAAQSYSNWELVIADASESSTVRDCVEKKRAELEEADKRRAELEAEDKKTVPGEKQAESGERLADTGSGWAQKIKYHALSKNEGISGNSNQALRYAEGDYIGLLDHDDLLAPDALYEMVKAVNELKEQEGAEAAFLYSDEDKCDEWGVFHYEPNIKSNFNFDFLLSNNYICHFLLMKAELIKELGFRPEFDGAQDYDLILRAAGRVQEKEIVHVGRVLYHWRCHDLSTAANPASKLYAYEAGKRAVQDFLDEKGIKGRVEDTDHMGFYRIAYEPDLLTARKDIGMLGGSVVDRNHKITGGILLKNGQCPFQGFYSFFSGPANVAAVARDAYALDARTVILRKEDVPLFEKIIKVPYVEKIEERDKRYCNSLDENIWRQRSMELSGVFRERGQRLVWDPEIQVRR